jgi:hypothetical protein
MKLYRQTARFILFGLVIVAMVFGIQTAAKAGAGPEPPTSKCGKFVPGAPWIVDLESYFTLDAGSETQGITTIVASVTYKDYKYSYSDSGPSSLIQFNTGTTKEALSQCVVNYGDFQDETGKPVEEGTLFAPFAVGGYKFDPIVHKVSARIIYGKVLPVVAP